MNKPVQDTNAILRNYLLFGHQFLNRFTKTDIRDILVDTVFSADTQSDPHSKQQIKAFRDALKIHLQLIQKKQTSINEVLLSATYVGLGTFLVVAVIQKFRQLLK